MSAGSEAENRTRSLPTRKMTRTERAMRTPSQSTSQNLLQIKQRVHYVLCDFPYSSDPYQTTMILNGVPVSMDVVTGAALTVINQLTYEPLLERAEQES